MANYPNRDGRIGNGVGLDTPASAAVVLQALSETGYDVAGAPQDGVALMALLTGGVTNAPGAADRAASTSKRCRWPTTSQRSPRSPRRCARP